MYDAIRHARTRRLVNFGVACNKIMDYKYGVPKSVVRELVDYRLSLTAMLDDELLRDLARNRLEVLEHLLDYVRAFNNGEKSKADESKRLSIEAWNAGDLLAEEIIKE